MSSATGVQQCEPSVLHVIVDAVSGVEGASHSSSSLASVPRCDAGEKPFVKSICLTPHSGPCSCGERDWALERPNTPPTVQTFEFHRTLILVQADLKCCTQKCCA